MKKFTFATVNFLNWKTSISSANSEEFKDLKLHLLTHATFALVCNDPVVIEEGSLQPLSAFTQLHDVSFLLQSKHWRIEESRERRVETLLI